MSDTIFYKMRLKRNKTVSDVFTKIQKTIKKKGPTKNWTYSVGDNEMIIDFGDNKSETFVLTFTKKEANGFCKVAFPMGGELFDDDKKSEFKAFIAMLHSIKSCCSEIEVTDDYDIAEEMFNSLDYTLIFRELNETEQSRVERLYSLGYTNHEDMLLAIVAEDLGLPEDFNWQDYLDSRLKLIGEVFPKISVIFEYYLYKAVLLKKKPLSENERYRFASGYGDPPAEVYTFALGVGAMFNCYNFIENTWGRGAQVTKYYKDKFLPIFEASDGIDRCVLAYRFMVSVFDFCKFTHACIESQPRKSYSDDYQWLAKQIS